MDALASIFGPDKATLAWWQEADRAVLVFFAGLALIRLSGLRTFSRYSPLDTVITITIGSNLSRVITGNAPLWPTLLASLVLVAVYRLLAQIAFRWTWLSRLLKGRSKPLIVGGVTQPATLRHEAITHGDLMEAIRLKGAFDLAEVETALIERNGEISLKKRG